MKAQRTQPSQLDLLHEAVTKPGVIATCYRTFYRYSVGNQLDAYGQCLSRKLELGPLNTYKGWEKLGRTVKKGEKALWMTIPQTFKDKRAEPKEDGTQPTKTWFAYKPRFFVLAQTEGEDYAKEALPAWDLDKALSTLDVTKVPFSHMDGNCQGYAKDRTIAVNPIAQQTLFHELGRVLLGHTAEGQQEDTPNTPRSMRELQAECVALLVSSALEMDGAEESRGYIQSWYKEKTIPKDVATAIMKTANQILKAGR